MVALFAGLKLRLLRNRRALGLGTIGQLLGLMLAVIVGGLIGLAIAQLHGSGTVAPLALSNLFFVLLLAWMVMPLVAFGVDETVDPRRFALLSIPARTLQRGLLVSALVGYLPLANLLALLGCAVALAPSWALFPVSMACAVALLLLCVICSRALAASMAGLMGSRRGRDLGLAVSFGLFALYYVSANVLATASTESFAGSIAGTIGRVLGYTPPGALAVIPSDLYAGQWVSLAVRLVVVIAAFLGAWQWWGRALTHSLTSAGSVTEASSAAHGLMDATAVATSQRGTARLVLGRDLTMMWRDPMRRMPLLMVALVGVGWPFVVARGEYGGYACLFGAVMAGTLTGSAYAVEGSGLWLHVVGFADRMRARGELWGHAVAAIIPGVLIVTVGIALQLAMRGGTRHLPAVAGVCLAGLLAGAAAAVAFSALLPYAVPQSRTSMFASRVPGQGGRAAGASLGVMVCGLLGVVPTAVLAALGESVHPAYRWAALASGALIGSGLLWLAVRMAADRYLRDTPEILQIVSAGDRI